MPAQQTSERERQPSVVLYPKPSGVTSHDVVASARRRLGGRVKVGHAGTLDPFATGLLILLVGRATRAQRFLMALPKTYRAVARLGWRSDTGDRDGTLTETHRAPEVLSLPTGRLLQRPPAYSAVKVDGERLYKKARRGEPIEGQAREVSVYRFELLWRDHQRAALEIECGAGTYVRQLVADLGDAYCEELERTSVGALRLEDADEDRLIPLAEVLAFLPERRLDEDEQRRVATGRAVAARGHESGDENVRLTYAGSLLAIARPDGELLRPVVVFPT